MRLRTKPGYNATVAAVGAAVASMAAFALVVDALIIRSAPRAVTLGCDISSRVSCTAVSSSTWSNLVPLWGTHVPNAVFGLALFPLMTGFLVALMGGFRPGRPLRILLGFGMGAAAVFALFLLAVSVLILGRLCPWCLTMDAGTLLMIEGWIRWTRVTGPSEGHTPIIASWVSIPIEALPFAVLAAMVMIMAM